MKENDKIVEKYFAQSVLSPVAEGWSGAAGRDVNCRLHGSIPSQHPEQDDPELVILPTVNDDVDAGVDDQEEMRKARHHLYP